MCDTISTSGIYVDAAVFALNGSLGDQNWDDAPLAGYVNLNGTDLSQYRGPFGISGGGGQVRTVTRRSSASISGSTSYHRRSSSQAAFLSGCSTTTSSA
jgi:hypothetical protein